MRSQLDADLRRRLGKDDQREARLGYQPRAAANRRPPPSSATGRAALTTRRSPSERLTPLSGQHHDGIPLGLAVRLGTGATRRSCGRDECRGDRERDSHGGRPWRTTSDAALAVADEEVRTIPGAENGAGDARRLEVNGEAASRRFREVAVAHEMAKKMLRGEWRQVRPRDGAATGGRLVRHRAGTRKEEARDVSASA